MSSEVPHPRFASREEWLAARKALLVDEKDLTRQKDRLSARRRRLPMVRVEKDYVFDSTGGKRRFAELFEGRRQLIVYHFMFDPAWEKGCPGCTGYVDALGDLSMLADRNTTFTLVSRAPLAKLEAWKAGKGWKVPWASSFGSDFNYDYWATVDEAVAPAMSNYLTKAEVEAKTGRPWKAKGEQPGLSVFFRTDDGVYHTYSSYQRGVESLTDAYSLLDVTPYGRQEDWEDSPEGWPQKPTYG